MKVKVPRLSGFCPGVKAAEKKIFTEIEKKPDEKHSVLGMMINNRKYISYLSDHRVDTLENVENLSPGATLFIRTHGIDRALQQQLSRSCSLIDLTCRNVKKVQEIIKEHSDAGEAVIITGKKSHPETIGLKSYASVVAVIETDEELGGFLAAPRIDGRDFDPSDYSGIFITSQTTGSRKLFESAIGRVTERWPESKVESFNSICPVTEKKETEALLLQQEVDISFVIGDPLSSNASKLFKRLAGTGRPSYFIQDADELERLGLDLSSYSSALVVSSASTPQFVEDEVVRYLESI